jgi:signal peptidase I
MKTRASILRSSTTALVIALMALDLGCGSLSQRFVMAKTSRSMLPTILPGQEVRVNAFDAGQQRLERYDIVVFHPPVAPAETWVMRVVGLPEDEIVLTNNSLVINGAPLSQHNAPTPLTLGPWLPDRLLQANSERIWHLAQDQVLVVGDNLQTAYDGRYWGPINMSAILGIVELEPQAIRSSDQP